MSFIYLAGPYSHPDPAVRERRYRAALAATVAMLNQGLHVYSPVVYSHSLVAAGVTLDHDGWMRHCLALLQRATQLALLCLPGSHDSKGMEREVVDWRRGDVWIVETLDPFTFSLSRPWYVPDRVPPAILKLWEATHAD